MNNFSEHLQELLKNEEFANAWNRTEPEYQAARAVLQARLSCNLTQKELSERSGIKQANLSRIETMATSPTVGTLAKIADGLGKELIIEFR